MKKKLLKKVVNLAVKTNDVDKLRYIGQSLDVMLFYPEYKKDYDYLYAIFLKICNYLNKNDKDLLGVLQNRNYPDLNAIGLIECVTFSNIEDNPVRPLDKEVIAKVIHEIKNPYETEPESYSTQQVNFMINSLQSLLTTDKEQPELPNYCNIAKQKCGCIGNFCSANGEQIDSIFS